MVLKTVNLERIGAGEEGLSAVVAGAGFLSDPATYWGWVEGIGCGALGPGSYN